MLTALLMLGFLPFVAMPFVEAQGARDSEDGVTSEPDPERDGDSLLDAVEEPAPEQDDAPDISEEEDAGEAYVFDAAPQDTVLHAFEPGLDSVEIDLRAEEGDLYFDTLTDADGSTLSLSVTEGALTLRFEGLQEVPASDILLSLTDDVTGEPYMLSLAEVLEGPETEDAPDETGTDEANVLDPTDPEAPDDPGPDVEGDVLDPTDPDLPDVPGPEVEGDVLDPVDPDAPDVPEGAEGLAGMILRDSANTYGLGAALDAAAASGVAETWGGAGDDVVTLAGGADGAGGTCLSEGTPVLSSDAGVAVVDGAGGDDTITAGDAAAFVFGGAGDDVLMGGTGAAALYGGEGQDLLTAGPNGAYLDGGAGDDTLTGGAGDDVLEGGEHGPEAAGDDLLDGGAGDDLIRGGLGSDTLLGGDGDDVIDHLGRAEAREVEEHREFAWHVDGGEEDSLAGGAGNDTLILGDADMAEGGAGDDLFWVYTSGAAPVEVADFTVGEDFLRVTLDPQIGETGAPEVSVAPSADAADALVTVNGDLVAILRGAPEATVSDVYAEVVPDIFPTGPGT